jgi:hypothetical protein
MRLSALRRAEGGSSAISADTARDSREINIPLRLSYKCPLWREGVADQLPPIAFVGTQEESIVLIEAADE